MNCELCDDGPAQAVARIDCITDDGKASVFCCEMHLVDGYSAAVILSYCDQADGNGCGGLVDPIITILDGVALTGIRCPLCGDLMTLDHAHESKQYDPSHR